MVEKYSYRIMWSEEDQAFIALCAEFPSLSWLGDTQDKAFKGIQKLVAEVLDDLMQQNEVVPEPLSIKSFSGKLMLRIPPELHRELMLRAMEQHVSLNRYITTKLA